MSARDLAVQVLAEVESPDSAATVHALLEVGDQLGRLADEQHTANLIAMLETGRLPVSAHSDIRLTIIDRLGLS